jgi:hypothetical protein
LSQLSRSRHGRDRMIVGFTTTCAYRYFQQYFSYIVAVSFIDWGNRSTRRKPPTCGKWLTNFITYCCIEHTWNRTRKMSVLYYMCKKRGVLILHLLVQYAIRFWDCSVGIVLLFHFIALFEYAISTLLASCTCNTRQTFFWFCFRSYMYTYNHFQAMHCY